MRSDRVGRTRGLVCRAHGDRDSCPRLNSPVELQVVFGLGDGSGGTARGRPPMAEQFVGGRAPPMVLTRTLRLSGKTLSMDGV